MPIVDPEARRAYQREYYAKRQKDQKREYQRRTRLGIVNPTSERKVGNCDICGQHSDPLRLDHDHQTGLARGWLCNACNLGIGKLQDSVDVLRKAIAYLESHSGRERG